MRVDKVDRSLPWAERIFDYMCVCLWTKVCPVKYRQYVHDSKKSQQLQDKVLCFARLFLPIIYATYSNIVGLYIHVTYLTLKQTHHHSYLNRILI